MLQQPPQAESEPTHQLSLPQTESQLPPIVGVGASAGGLEAFSDLLSHLPPDTGLCYVFIQHLDPRHESRLAELLQQHTTMPVMQAANGMRPAKDCVYVIPPNTSMEMSDHTLKVTSRPPTPQQMPIDSFFRSLAANIGPMSIGVVLSGSASDGTLGLKAIKGEGGITFAQEPASASFDGMPRSAIAAGCVDFVMTPAAIAQELERVSRLPYVADHEVADGGTPEVEKDLAEIFAILRSTVNVDFNLYKHGTIRRRIFRRMALDKIETPGEYVKLLHESRQEVEALFQDLLINVTSFFREPATLHGLHDRVFPLLLQNRGADDPIRIWVPGCATGEEAYSAAMALYEFAAERARNITIQIFGTDLSETALERARAGLYLDSISADVSQERLRKFFTKVNGHYQINRTIRDLCIFARQDLTKDPPFSHLDLLICRNVLIYLGPVLQKKVMKVFHYALRPSGFLVLGASESLGSSNDLFTPIDRSLRIYSRKVAPGSGGVDLGSYEEVARKSAPQRGRLEGPTELQKRIDAVLLSRYTPAAVAITRDLRIVQFHGQTRRFLEHNTGAANLNLERMARGGIGAEIRSLIEEVETNKAPIAAKVVSIPLEEAVAEVRLSVSPIDGLPGESQFLVVFEEMRDRRQPAIKDSPARGRRRKPGLEESRVMELEEELSVTRRYLQTVIEDQEAITEELKSANEEIQSSNEELQSTNEELLTAKEELQSTNEELTTVNEEMQNRNDELVRTNNDLLNLLSSVNIPIVMLGSDLKIRRFTPQTERLLNLLPTDVGRSITDFKLKINVPDLEDLVHGVLDHLTPLEREVVDREGRVFSMWVRPYRTSDNKIDGAVLALFDVTDRKHATDARFRRLFEASRDGIIIADHASGAILDSNPLATRLLGRNRSDLLGVPVFALEVFSGAAIRPQTLAELRDKESLRREVNFVRPDGEWMEIEILANAYEEPDRHVVQFNLRDMGGRRRERTREADQGQEIRGIETATRIATSLSRDFGNDLTIILVLCDLLLRDHRDASFAADLVTIREAASRAVDLDRQLVAFGRQDTGRRELLNLNQVLSGMDQLIHAAMGERYTIERKTDPDLKPIEANPAQLERIILNLLINAHQPGDAAGNISVQTANIAVDPEFCAHHPAVKPGEYVCITVTDSARPSRSDSRAADPFRADPAQYSGLPAAFEAIRELGAQVWAFSELGVGSTIRVFFQPAQPEPAAEDGADAAAKDIASGWGTVLLIEPDDDVRTAAARGLEAEGFIALQARNIAEAAQIPADREIQAVIADATRQSDPAQARAFAGERKAAIAFISSEADAILAQTGVLDHPDLLLRKPFSAQQMASFVRALLRGKPAG